MRNTQLYTLKYKLRTVIKYLRYLESIRTQSEVK